MSEQQKVFDDKAQKLALWLNGAENKLTELRKDADKATDLPRLQDAVKILAAEAISKDADMAEVTTAAKDCQDVMKIVGGNANDVDSVSSKANKLRKQLEDLHARIADLANKVQLAVLQSQGMHEGLDTMLNWAKGVEKSLLELKPISLNPSVLPDQKQEIGMLKADVDSHLPGLELLKTQVADMAASGNDKAGVKVEEQKLQKLNESVTSFIDRCDKRETNIKDITRKLDEFTKMTKKFLEWIAATEEKLDMKDLPRTNAGALLERLAEIRNDFDEKEKDWLNIKSLADSLLKDPRTGDSGYVKDKTAQCEKSWTEMLELLADREKDIQDLKDSEENYKMTRDSVFAWLSNSENQLQQLEGTAGDIETMQQKVEELKKLEEDVDKHQDSFNKLNDVGQLLDSLQHPELKSSPLKRSKLLLLNFIAFNDYDLFHAFQ